MKEIKAPIKSVEQLLGKQEIQEDAIYRRISFCVLTAVDGVNIAYNSLTGALIELSEEEYKLLSSEALAYEKCADELIEKWFLVPSEHDDIKLCDEVRDFLAIFRKEQGISAYTIFTTMDCNARCFYCYELGRPRIHMQVQTAKDIVEFIKKNCNKEKKVSLAWFGGEPLYNYPVIDIITSGLKESGIEFSSQMTTNAYLFDDSLVKKAVEEWKLFKVQITIDGTEEIYNKAKAYINSEGLNPFIIVTDNIERLLKNNVKVSIRVNLGTHNKDDLFALADWLADRYKGCKGLSVYAQLLFSTEHKKDILKGSRDALANDLMAFTNYCYDKKLASKGMLGDNLKLARCMADTDSAVTITPTGKLGKCEHYSEDEFIGDIYEGITIPEKVAEFKERVDNRETCKGCTSYPLCVHLKKCPEENGGICVGADREIVETKLRLKTENTYRKLKEN